MSGETDDTIVMKKREAHTTRIIWVAQIVSLFGETDNHSFNREAGKPRMLAASYGSGRLLGNGNVFHCSAKQMKVVKAPSVSLIGILPLSQITDCSTVPEAQLWVGKALVQ